MHHKSAVFIVILSLITVQEFALLDGSKRSSLVKGFTDDTQTNGPAANNRPQPRDVSTLNGDNSDGFSDVSALAGPPHEDRRPPGPGRRGPERSGREGRRDLPDGGPHGGDGMSEGSVSENMEKSRRPSGDMERQPRAPEDDRRPDDHAPRHRKASLYGAPEEQGHLRRESEQSGIMQGDKMVVSRQRRDSGKRNMRKDRQRGNKDQSNEDSDGSNEDNSDGKFDDFDDNAERLQKQRRGGMSQRQGSGLGRGPSAKDAGCYWYYPRRRGGGGNGNGGGDNGGGDDGGGDDGGGDDGGGDDGGDGDGDYDAEDGRYRRRRRRNRKAQQAQRMRRRRRKSKTAEGADKEGVKE